MVGTGSKMRDPGVLGTIGFSENHPAALHWRVLRSADRYDRSRGNRGRIVNETNPMLIFRFHEGIAINLKLLPQPWPEFKCGAGEIHGTIEVKIGSHGGPGIQLTGKAEVMCHFDE